MNWPPKRDLEADVSSVSFSRKESRNCGLSAFYAQKYGAVLLVGAWQGKKQQNNLVE